MSPASGATNKERVYTSPYPSQPIPECSIWTHLYPPPRPKSGLNGAIMNAHTSSANMGPFDKFPEEHPAFIDGMTGLTLSRGDMRRLTLAFAYGITHLPHFPLEVGQTILIFSPNSLAYPVMAHGAAAAGLRATLANSAYTASELMHQYVNSNASIALVHPDLVPVALEMFALLKMDNVEAKKRIVIAHFPGTDSTDSGAFAGYTQLSEVLESGRGKLTSEIRFDGTKSRETVFLCYSSGTTGLAKGVETMHRNLTSLMSILGASYLNDLNVILSDRSVKTPKGEVHLTNDVMLGVLPLYHIYGAVKLMLFPFTVGLPVVIMPKFDPVNYCALVERYRCTISLIVPPILLVLTHHPAVTRYNMSSLRLLFSGAAPLGAPLVDAVRKRLASAGANVDVTQGYGLTETSPTTHILEADNCIRKIGSIGRLLPNLEARLVVDDVADADDGKPGELWIRGPTVMKGYLKNPAATQDAITSDGWFKTGDVAIVDLEGYYFIVDRRKELIKYKGFQVPPAELESVLLQHPDIIDAAVIGIDSEREQTELPRAYICPRDTSLLRKSTEGELFAKDVQKWVEGRVARHKFLRGGVVLIDAIPKSAAGKILRRHLRDQAKSELVGKEVKAKL